MFNIDAKKIQGMMSKMGIRQEDIKATRVIIEQEDKKIIIENPSVAKISMSGQETYQISGKAKEETSINEEDIKMIMEKTGKAREKIILALEKNNNDIAETILNLS